MAKLQYIDGYYIQIFGLKYLKKKIPTQIQKKYLNKWTAEFRINGINSKLKQKANLKIKKFSKTALKLI